MQGDHEKPSKQLEAAKVQAQQPKGLEDAAHQPEKQRQVRHKIQVILQSMPFSCADQRTLHLSQRKSWMHAFGTIV